MKSERVLKIDESFAKINYEVKLCLLFNVLDTTTFVQYIPYNWDKEYLAKREYLVAGFRFKSLKHKTEIQ